MRVELTSVQRDVLLELVDEAIKEIGPEIHHTRTRSFKDDLREFRHDLKSLRGLLTESPQSPESPTSEPASSGSRHPELLDTP